jgi:para-nitrobenzyl esterase
MRPILSLLAFIILAACTTVPPLPAGQVATRQGIVAGTTDDGITAWRGIEYARAARWQMPGPGPSWDGVKQADTLGPACPQAGQTAMVEDCLFLNVFAPDSASAHARLPVVVWFHGGGFRAGSGGNGPRHWAREGMIVVTLNYRLGILGFHDWLGWSESDPRNFGQADMVAALRWVSANIAGFGGDPGRVTIYGHSAGGMAVQLMMVDPRARGLFQRAIADAAYASWPFPKAANPSPEMRMRIRYGPLETGATAAELVARVPHFHLPYTGGSDLRDQPVRLLADGPVRPVPMITGFTSYDGGGTLAGAGYTPDSFLALFADPAPIRAAYADDFAVSELQGAERAFGDRRYGLSARQSLAAVAGRGQAAWGFHVDGPVVGAGVGHGAYYGALFGPGGLAQSPMGQAFVGFIKTGSPSAAGVPDWPRYSSAGDDWMVFSPQPRRQAGLLKARLDRLEAAALATD